MACPAGLRVRLRNNGLVRRRGERFQVFGREDGLPNEDVRALHEDGDGTLWILTLGGLARWQPAGMPPFRTVPAPFPDRLKSMYGDADGTLWIGTWNDGLLRYRDGELTAYTVAGGIYDRRLHQIVDDGRGWLWMSSNRGIFRVRKAELEAHDLKSPLFTIEGFLGLLVKDLEGGARDRVSRDVEHIRTEARKMHRLLAELLELSRVGRVVHPAQEVDLGDLAREAVALAATSIAERGVEVTVAPDMPRVTGDRIRLLEVLQNLVENAVKYMGDERSPRIEIDGVHEGGEVVCRVRDNGIGIEARYHEKVFGLFEQLDPRTEGTGIGLALAKRIVEFHGGRIWLESEGAGRGSTFLFALPISAVRDSQRTRVSPPEGY